MKPLKLSIKIWFIVCVVFLLIGAIGRLAYIESNRKAQLKQERHLFYAISRNDSEMLIQMINEGRDVNEKWNGQSTVQAALVWTRPTRRERTYDLQDLQQWDSRASELICILLQNGFDLKSLERDWSPLAFASCWHLEKTVAILLEAGANPNPPYSSKGASPLHDVFLFYDAEGTWNNDNILMMLIDYGADVNYPDNNGDTPLHKAIHYSVDSSVIRYMLDAGADPAIKNLHGETPLDMARRFESDTVSVLEGHMKTDATNGMDSDTLPQ